MCFICSKTKGFETDIAEIIKINKNSNLDISNQINYKLSEPTIGHNNNKYTFNIIGLDESSPLYEGIKINSIAGIEYISTKLKWKGSLDFVANIGGQEEWFTSGQGFGSYGNSNDVLYEATTGIDLYPQRPDGWDEWAQVDWDLGTWINLNKNKDGIDNYGVKVFIDPNPIPELDDHIPSNTHDYFGLFIHEFLHTMGFTNWNEKFLSLIESDNGKNYLKGEASLSFMKEGIELEEPDLFHYATSLPDKYDIMGQGLYERNRWTFTDLDQAIFGDLGYGIVRSGSNSQDNIIGGLGDDVIHLKGGKDIVKGRSGDDTIDGGNDYDIATYSGNFSDYTFTIENKIITIIDNRLSTNDGIDTLSNIEKLTFADKNALVTSKEIKSINSLGFQSTKNYSGKSVTYKFYNLGSDKYGIETNTGIDELTGASILKFDDKDINLINDIKGTFDQITGLNTASGEMFRLYNAAFARFPDADGLKYWISKYSSGENDSRAVASSFLASSEFTEKYGSNVSDETYVNNLYKNVLGRDADSAGLNYWVGNLSSGKETRYEALLGFAESAENKVLFTEMTGFA